MLRRLSLDFSAISPNVHSRRKSIGILPLEDTTVSQVIIRIGLAGPL